MPLSQVLEALESAGVSVSHGARTGDPDVAGVCQDSRAVESGDLFVAWRGAAHDSHAFLADVARGGAVAALVERVDPEVDLLQLPVDNARLAVAVAADVVGGSPWRTMRTVGVTGTNGKTTTALLIRALMAGSGPTAAIGTLGLTLPDGTRDPETEGLTTPGPVQVSEWMSELARGGATGVVLETSSHALAQHRLDGLRFDVMVFTNLTRDHLDYHGGWEGYLVAKARLLSLAKPDGVAVMNADVPAWRTLETEGPVLTYGVDSPADLKATDLVLGPEGTVFDLEHETARARVRLPLLGRFNVENALAAAGASLALGSSLEDLARALESVPQVPGRLERVTSIPFDVLIDFAHTPDALDRVLETLRPLVAGRLIVVFGAGGDRDRTKRPKMGEAVSRHADLAVVTSDNPRTEDPEQITLEVEAGVTGIPSRRIVERREAIAWALTEAEGGDMVLLAGKGHETYQVVGREKLPFNEREIVLELLGGEGGR